LYYPGGALLLFALGARTLKLSVSKRHFDWDFLFNTESFFVVPREIGDAIAEKTVELKAGGGKCKQANDKDGFHGLLLFFF